MIEKIYFDKFKNEHVITLDPDTPPERYVEIIRGKSPLYKERWYVNSKYGATNLTFTYTIEQSKDKSLNELRSKHAQDCDAYLIALESLTLPPDTFDHTVKKFLGGSNVTGYM